MIESEVNQKAESPLSGLIAGTSVSGMRFGGIPQILFSTEKAPGEPYINLGQLGASTRKGPPRYR